jgi:hypothetical protein
MILKINRETLSDDGFVADGVIGRVQDTLNGGMKSNGHAFNRGDLSPDKERREVSLPDHSIIRVDYDKQKTAVYPPSRTLEDIHQLALQHDADTEAESSQPETNGHVAIENSAVFSVGIDSIETSENQAEQVHPLRFTASRLAVNGIAASLGFANWIKATAQSGQERVGRFYSGLKDLQVPDLEIRAKDRLTSPRIQRIYQKAGVIAVSSAAALTSTSEFLSEKTKTAYGDVKEKWQTMDKRKAARRAVGTIALTAVGIAAIKYGVNLGGGVSRTHEQAHDLINQPAINVPHHIEGSAAIHQTPESVSNLHTNLNVVHAIGKSALSSAHETAKYHTNRVVEIMPGAGYTQAIKERFAGHSPAEYYAAYKEGIKQLGPNFIHGVRHYQMGSDWGLMPGKGHFTKTATDFFSGYFRSNR